MTALAAGAAPLYDAASPAPGYRVNRTAAAAAVPLARTGARGHPSGGWWGLRPRIGRGRGARVLMPDERRGRHSDDPGPFGGFGPLAVRLVIGGLLVVLSSDKIADDERLALYAEGLATGMLPALTVAAMLVYMQLVAGIGLALGLLTRPMALLAAIYAVVALIVVRSGIFSAWVVPLATLAGAVFLMLRGAGRLSLDGLRRRR